MIVPDTFVALARTQAYRRKLKFKRSPPHAEQWRRVGSGWFSEVWEHPDYPGLVLKVSGKSGFGSGETDSYTAWPITDAWQVYAQYCQKHPHEHLPQILHFERINASTAWAIMPKYDHAEHTQENERTRLQWGDWLNGGRGAPEWMWPIVGMAASLYFRVDLHTGNIMVRNDGILVMTDPFSIAGI